MAAGGGGSGVLYKRIPPPEPKYDGPRFRTSPSYQQECYPQFGSTADHLPADAIDGYNLNTHHLSDGDEYLDPHPNSAPMYLCGFASSMTDHTPDGDGFKTPERSNDYLDQSPSYSDDCAFTAADHERQTNEYATAALDHYNGQNQNQNQVKYELVQAITSAAIFSARGFYGHVNFTAKSNLENSKEEFMFAELYYDSDSDVYIPTCIVSLQGSERVGGVRGIESADFAGVYYGKEIPVDPQHCYACLEEVKHPKDGTLYETGHHVGGLYGYL